MKFLLLAALIAVAVAAPRDGLVVPVAAGPAPVIIDEFQPIAVGPAIIDQFQPIAVGPAIIDQFEPISIAPEIVEFPVPSPVIDTPAAPVTPSASAPLVQIILNINQATETGPVAVTPVVVPEIVKPDPVHVVEFAPEPVHVVESAPEPVHVVEIAPEPVQVIETAPVAAEPVLIGTPILPAPAVILPEELN